MSADPSCTSLSSTIPQPFGPHNNFVERFHGTKRRSTSCTIATARSTPGRTTATAIGIAEVVTAVRSWQNAYAERLIGSIRRECLDHLIIGNERGLRRVLHAYVESLSEIPNAPVARQRCARLATSRIAERRRDRGDSAARWPASPLRTPRSVRYLLTHFSVLAPLNGRHGVPRPRSVEWPFLRHVPEFPAALSFTRTRRRGVYLKMVAEKLADQIFSNDSSQSHRPVVGTSPTS